MAYFGILAAILLVQGIAGASLGEKAENAQRNVNLFGLVDVYARNGDFPYHVSIQKEKVKGKGVFVHECNGVLISEKHVLTSGRCYNKDNGLAYLVKAGSVSQSFSEPDVQTFSVNATKSFVHESFDTKSKYSDNDIAILTLVGSVKPSGQVKPLTLPSSKEEFNSSLKYVVTGWGLDTTHQSELKFHKLFVIDNEVCRESWKYDFPDSKLSSNQFCSISPSGVVYTQDGDSGSPLVRFNDKREAILVGIATAPTYTGNKLSKRLVFTKVSAFLEWIDNKQNGASALTYGYVMILAIALSLAKTLF